MKFYLEIDVTTHSSPPASRLPVYEGKFKALPRGRGELEGGKRLQIDYSVFSCC